MEFLGLSEQKDEQKNLNSNEKTNEEKNISEEKPKKPQIIFGKNPISSGITRWYVDRKEKLNGPIVPPKLPTDFKREKKITYSGGIEFIEISHNTVVALKAICANEKVTLFELTLTTFFILIYMYTGQDDLLIGVPTVNRKLEQFHRMFGLFTNTLLYKICDVTGVTTRQLLQIVSKTNREALNNQNLPFDRLIRELNPERIFGSNPLLSVFFSYQNFPKMFDYPELKASPLKVDYGVAYFELELIVEEVSKNSLYLTINYYKDLFNTDTIKVMLSLYKKLLENFEKILETRIFEINLEKNDKIYQNTAFSYSSSYCANFLDLFEKQVELNPTSVAVKDAERAFTYDELNSIANQLGNYLKNSGVAVGERIGLLMERSSFAIIGLLGIIKCGGVYVPIDPDIPEDRINYIIKDAGIATILCDKEIRGIKNISIVSQWDDLQRERKDNLDLDVPMDSLVYIIYTSGSTGNPKGVCVENRQLSSYIESIWSNMRVTQSTRFAMLTSLASDIGHAMIFAPLSYGASVIMVPNQLVFDLDNLSIVFAQNPIDCMKLTPTHISMFLESGIIKNLLPKKLLIIAGETLHWSLIAQIRKYSNCRINNCYGPTETTVSVLVYEIPELANHSSNVPLGFPILNSEIYIFNASMTLVQIGAVGELHIGRNGVARGYLNLPGLTSEKFIIKDGKRLYKTGDLVRCRGDGTIEFIGRRDRQLKVFGHRVELDEIEATLASHSGVKKAAVTIVDKVMVGYISLCNRLLTCEELKEFLRKKLPTYMIPTKIVFLDELPLTSSGKVNYNVLPTNFQHENSEKKSFLEMK